MYLHYSILFFISSVNLKLQCTKWWMWKCPHESKCIELYSVCNGKRDCSFGGDEGTKLCTKRYCETILGGRWKCPNEAKCIFKFQVCDSENDCDDGSDETEQACTKDICNNSGRWKCPNQNKCLNQDSLCNSIFDCNDKADEHMEACMEACPNRGQLPCLAKGYGNKNTQSQIPFVEVGGNKCIEPDDVCLDKKGFFGNLEANKCDNMEELKARSCLNQTVR